MLEKKPVGKICTHDSCSLFHAFRMGVWLFQYKLVRSGLGIGKIFPFFGCRCYYNLIGFNYLLGAFLVPINIVFQIITSSSSSSEGCLEKIPRGTIAMWSALVMFVKCGPRRCGEEEKEDHPPPQTSGTTRRRVPLESG